MCFNRTNNNFKWNYCRTIWSQMVETIVNSSPENYCPFWSTSEDSVGSTAIINNCFPSLVCWHRVTMFKNMNRRKPIVNFCIELLGWSNISQENHCKRLVNTPRSMSGDNIFVLQKYAISYTPKRYICLNQIIGLSIVSKII